MSFGSTKKLTRTPLGKPPKNNVNDEVWEKHVDPLSVSRVFQSTVEQQGEKTAQTLKNKKCAIKSQIEITKTKHAMSLRSAPVRTVAITVPDNSNNNGDSRSLNVELKSPIRTSNLGPQNTEKHREITQSRSGLSESNRNTCTTRVRNQIWDQMENIRNLERIREDREIEFAKQKLHYLKESEGVRSSRCASSVKSNEIMNRTCQWIQSHQTSNAQQEVQPESNANGANELEVQQIQRSDEKAAKGLVFETVFNNNFERRLTPRQPFIRSTPLEEQLPNLEEIGPRGMSSWNIQLPKARANTTLVPEQVASRLAFSSKELPSFNGNPLEWPKFISSYVFSTKQCGYSNVDNLMRLQRALKPPAYDLVRNRLIVPETVPGVIEKLRAYYGRPEVVLRALTQQVRNLQPVKTDKYASLINFAAEVDNLCGLAEASQLKGYMNNPTLIEELVDKLPYHLGMEWGNHSKRLGSIDLSDFSCWLNEITEGAVKVSKIDLSQFIPNEKKSVNKSGNKPMGIAAHQVKTMTNDKSMCIICQVEHPLVKCAKFLAMNCTKRWELIRNHRWCGKCIQPHNFRRCFNKQRCRVDECNRAHHHLLHGTETIVNQPKISTVNNEASSTVMKISLHPDGNSEVLYRIVPVNLYGLNGQKLKTFAFLDDGANGTIMEEWVAEYLGLQGPKVDVCLQWTKEITTMEEGSMTVSPKISGADGDAEQFILESVRTAKSLALPCQSLAIESLPDYIKELPIAEYKKAKPTILIGSDEAWLTVPTEVRQNGRHSPIATKTKLGWSVHGKHSNHKVELYNHEIKQSVDYDDDLQELVNSFYTLDNYGIEHNKLIEPWENKRSREILQKTTKYTGDRYQSGLLWKFEEIKFPNSISMALRRLDSFESKLMKNPELGSKVKHLIQTYKEKGYIRKLEPDETVMKSRSWYLPIFVVQNPNKPNKVRLVWDAAAKVDGVSLNSKLMKGPDELAPLPSVLFKFREERIAVTGDIKEMFHQILVTAKDTDSQRFLWRDLDTSRKPDTYIMKVMTFGATCSPSIAQFIKDQNAEQFKSQYPRAVEAIQHRHYVDDWLDSFRSMDEAIQTVLHVRTIHQHAGFLMRGWISNSPDLLQAIGTDVKEQSNEIRHKGTIGDKVLGMWWDHKNDNFRFVLNINRIDAALLDGSKTPTKREILRVLMSVFDPLGLISNLLIYAKLILQEVWRSGTDWDEPIKDKLNERWKIWVRHLVNVDQLYIPRCYDLGSRPATYQLHVFVDASQNAYAAVAYIRTTTANGVTTALVASKTRVAPNNKLISIPRLELMAAVLGARLGSSIIKSHSISIGSKHYWTDSKTVIGWLRSEARNYKQFVAFRITECLEKSKENEWHWLAGKENVADEATKWTGNLPNYETGSRWVQGPAFLKEPQIEWPIAPNEDANPTEEFRMNYHRVISVEPPIAINPDNCSTWAKLLRAQVNINRARHMFLSLIKRSKPMAGPKTYKEFQHATMQLIKRAQWDKYSQEISTLNLNNNSGVDRASQIYKCSPHLDENGVLRVRGRTDAATCIPYNTKRKKILPGDHRITYLRVHEYHVIYQHHNNETVVNELRQIYEVPRLRNLLRKIQFDCPVCKQQKANPKPPEMAPLPPARLAAFCRPFSYVGIDLFGPITVVVGRRSEKRWGVVFTCLTIRAIHLEVSSSLSTDSFIQCLLRFRARRGNPLEIYTDNGTNFKGAEKELKQEFIKLDYLEAQKRLASFKWNFIPPSAPHFGGAWERMVRSVKTNLYKILGNTKLTDEILHTSLAEVENIINTRPLTYLPVNAENEAITPNHFLLGASSGAKPLAELDSSAKTVNKNWLVTQKIANQFWKRWIVEYLPVITKRTKWFEKAPPLAIGDVVLIVDERNPRGNWPKGVITDVHWGKGDQIRSAVVRTTTGLYTRPSTKLAKLDINGENSLTSAYSPGGSVNNEAI